MSSADTSSANIETNASACSPPKIEADTQKSRSKNQKTTKKKVSYMWDEKFRELKIESRAAYQEFKHCCSLENINKYEKLRRATRNRVKTLNRAKEKNEILKNLVCLEAEKIENLSDWYSEVITKSEMIEYNDIAGCYILRPWSYSIWEEIKDFFSAEIKKLGVQNCSFPIIDLKAPLETENANVSGAAEPVAATSETAMYPCFAKWLKSYGDLPLKLNQWNSVVRWEFKDPQPFMGTREFLWQEGHSVFAKKEEAEAEVTQMLDLYRRVYEELLAVPVISGRKSEKEKFADGEYTTTVEAFVSARGRGIQGASSHHLGQNYSKKFNIGLAGKKKHNEKTLFYQNSWSLTTRAIGVMTMVHGDDNGLVLPPKLAPTQVIIIPCGIKDTTSKEELDFLVNGCRKLEKQIRETIDIRIEGDYRNKYNSGWKFKYWEMKGVPIRLQFGPNNLINGKVTLARRDNFERFTIRKSEAKEIIEDLLITIQAALFDKAKTDLDAHIKLTNNWNDFCTHLNEGNLLLSPFCGEIACEENIERDSAREDPVDNSAPVKGAKSLCSPFVQPEEASNLSTEKCIHPACTKSPQTYMLFGYSF